MAVLLQRWQQDTWVIPCQVLDTVTGQPIDLTGCLCLGEFVASGSLRVQPLNAANSGAVVTNPPQGQFTVTVPSSYTATAPADAGTNNPLPTRVKLFYIDPNGRRQTFGVLYFEVFDGSEDMPEIDENSPVQIVYQSDEITLSVVGFGGGGSSGGAGGIETTIRFFPSKPGQQQFTVPSYIGTPRVSLNGVEQNPSYYTLSGTTLTLPADWFPAVYSNPPDEVSFSYFTG